MARRVVRRDRRALGGRTEGRRYGRGPDGAAWDEARQGRRRGGVLDGAVGAWPGSGAGGAGGPVAVRTGRGWLPPAGACALDGEHGVVPGGGEVRLRRRGCQAGGVPA